MKRRIRDLVFDKPKSYLTVVAKTAIRHSEDEARELVSKFVHNNRPANCRTLKTNQIALVTKPLAHVIFAQTALLLIAASSAGTQGQVSILFV